MLKWKLKKLSDIAEFNPQESIKKGKLAKKVPMEKLIPYCKQIPSYEMCEFNGGTKFRNGDTIMARITPCLENGKISKVDILDKEEIGFGSTEYIIFRAIENITDPDFLYYLVTSPLVKELAIKSMVGSSGRQRVQTDVVKNIEISVPPFDIQQKIASILSTLDNKISLNSAINNNLEQQAQALFLKIMNVQDFENKLLSEVSIIKYGKGLPTNKLTKTGYKVFGGDGIIGYYADYLYQDPQILISCRGAASGTILVSHPYSYVTNNSLVIELNDRIYYEFLKQYFLLNQLHSYATGSAQPQITIDN
jgi:type I restriction enzyme S subunit